MHANSGYRPDALALSRRFVDVFREYDVVVSPSSSCVGNVREVYPQLAHEAGDAALERDVRELAPRVFELSELLVKQLGVEDVGATFPHRVAYHPTCHSLRVTHVGEAPLTLLRQVRGLELMPFARANECCGFGGTFALKNAATSTAMLSDKCDELVASGAEVCTAVDAMHLAEILASQA
jgi:L-lactate dehydrogenase complex protein LldE